MLLNRNKTQVKLPIPKGNDALKKCLMIKSIFEAYNQKLTSYTITALNQGFNKKDSNQYNLHKYLIWSTRDNAWVCSPQDNDELSLLSLSDFILILESDKKEAVCALIFNDKGQILMVSRKDNPLDFGLPGGKVDLGEDRNIALEREVLEETGFIIKIETTAFIHCDGKYEVTTYLCRIIGGSGETTEKGVVKYGSFSEITNPSSSFHEYNALLLDCLLQYFSTSLKNN